VDYDVVEARHLGACTVWLRFRDGTQATLDLLPELIGPVLEPLRDPGVFRTFRLSPDFHTLEWPNGADIAPERLHQLARGRG